MGDAKMLAPAIGAVGSGATIGVSGGVSVGSIREVGVEIGSVMIGCEVM